MGAGVYAILYPPPVNAAKRLAVLASGRGSNLRALVDAHERGDLSAEVVLVVSNNSGAGALAFARDHGIEARHISGKTHADVGAALLRVFEDHAVDVIALAGYMKQLDPRIVQAYRDRIVNIHNGPLPRFGGRGMYGIHTHQAVLDAGVSMSGPTVHLVNEVYDDGRILAHREVPVNPDDTAESLEARVLVAEHDLYWRAIQDTFCAK